MRSSRAEPRAAAALPLGGQTPTGLLAVLIVVPLLCHPDFTAFAPSKTFALLALIGLATLLAGLQGVRLARREPLFLAGVIWALWQLAHLPFVVDPIRGAIATASGVSAWLIALLIARSYPPDRIPQRPLGLALTVGALVSAVAWTQVLGLDLLGLRSSPGTALEAIGTLGNTNHLSEYLVPIVWIGCVVIAVLPGGFYRIVAIASTLLVASAVGAAQARAAAVAWTAGFGALLVGWLWFRWSRPVATRRLTALGVVAVGAIAAAIAGTLLLDTSEGTARVRLLVWERSLELWEEAPLAGIGPGQFLIQFPRVRDPEEVELSSPGHTIDTVVSTPHNELVGSLVESGLVGSLLLVAAFGFALLRLIGLLRRNPSRQEAWLALGVGAALVAASVNALFSSPLTRNPSSLAVIAALVGCAFAVSRVPERPAGRAGVLQRASWSLIGLALLGGGVWGLWQQIVAAQAWRADRDGEYLEAVERLRDAVRLDPSDARSRTRLAHLLNGLQRLDEAIAEQRQVVVWRPNSPAAWLTLGAWEASAGHRREAAEALQRALELDENDPRVHANLARLVRFEAGGAEAFPWLQRAARAAPRYAQELEQWGTAFFESGDLENAARYLDAYLQHEPDDAEAWITLSRVMRARGDLDSAERFSTRGHYFFGREYLQQAGLSKASGQEEAAAEQLRQAERQLRIAARFDHLEAHLYLSAVQLERGDREAALESATRAREIGGDEALRLAKERSELERLMKDPAIGDILSGD